MVAADGAARKAVMSTQPDPITIAAPDPETPDLAAILVATIGAAVERQLAAHARRTTELVDQREAALRADITAGDAAAADGLAQIRDEITHSVTAQLNAAIQSIHDQFEAGLARIEGRLAEQVTMLAGRIDTTEHGITDRMLAMEERVNEQNGTKIAQLEATIGRIGSGFDEAIVALSQRMLDLDNRLLAVDDRFSFVQTQLDQVGPIAVEAVKEQLSAAVGEAMLVRIEIDRLAASVDEKLDKSVVRMAEIEAKLADTMDVEAAVQLDRLEDLERALAELDPDTIVRKPAPERRPLGDGDGVGTSW